MTKRRRKPKLWDGIGPVLADTSAWMAVRRLDGKVRSRFLAAVERGEVAWCWPVAYELMMDARGPEAIAAVDETLVGLREIAVDRTVQRGVLSAMRELANEGSHGSHRFPLVDLTVAVAAQTAGIEVLHFDRHFDRLTDLLGVSAVWVAEPPA